MAVLPDIRGSETVLFHRDADLPSEWIVLQVPVSDKVHKSNTFRIDLSKGEDRAWFYGIEAHRRISDALGLYGHVIYFPGTGEVVPVEDRQVEEMTLAQLFFASAKQEQAGRKRRWADVPLGVRRKRTPLR